MKPNTLKSKNPFKLLVIALSSLIIAACVSQHDGIKKDLPTQAMATATDSNLEEIGEGHAIYMRHCSQCHEPKLPSTIPSDVWHVIVPGMAWNAGLTEVEEKQVTAYIKAASKYNEMQAR